MLYELSFKPRNAAHILNHAGCMAGLSTAIAAHAQLPACVLHPVVHTIHNMVYCPDAAATLLCSDVAASSSNSGGLVPALAGCLLSDLHCPSHACDSQAPASPFVAAVVARTLQRLALYAQGGSARRGPRGENPGLSRPGPRA